MVIADDGPRGRAPATIRRDLEQGCKQLQGFHAVALLPTQIVALQAGLHAAWQTLSGHPNRLHQWTRAAIEIAHKYA